MAYDEEERGNGRLTEHSYHAEPSGTFYRYDAKAIGSGSEGAQAELQNEFHKSLTLPEAEDLVLKTLKQVMEEKLDQNNVQVAQVRSSMQIYDIGKLTNVYSGNTREGLRDPGQCGSAGGDRCHVNARFLHR